MSSFKSTVVGGRVGLSAKSLSTFSLRKGNARFLGAVLAMGLATPISVRAGTTLGNVINFHEASNGAYSYPSVGYDGVFVGQGALSDPGNNVWNGFGKYSGGPGSTYFYGNSTSPHYNNNALPGNPGNPYSWFNGTQSTGTHLFSPTQYGAYGPSDLANAYSNGTASPIQINLNYTGENGGANSADQGKPKFITGDAALVNNGAVGSVTLTNVPAGSYDLFLYGANYDGTRGASFSVSSGIAVNGVTQTINTNANPNGPLTSFVLGADYVEFTNVVPTNGTITGTWSGVSNPISGLSGEGDFNGLQLAQVINTDPVYVYYGFDTLSPSGTPDASFGGSGTNFNLSGSSVAFSNGSTGSIALFDDTAAGSHMISIVSGGVSPDITEFNNASTSYTLTGGPIAGPGSVLLESSGTVTVTNSNSYTGATTIEGGTLVLNPGSSLASQQIAVGTGAVLNFPTGTTMASLTAANLAVNDSGTINLGGSENLGSLGGSGVVAFNVSNATLTVTGGSFAGTISASGDKVMLAGAGGTFSVPYSNGSSPNALIVNSTGAWTISGVSTFTGGTTLTAGVAVAGSSSPFGNGPVVLAGGSIGAGDTAGNSIIPGVVSGGALTLSNNGAGVVELSGTNTFTGPVVLTGTSGSSLGGQLQIDNPSSLGTAKTITVQSGATLVVADNSGSAGLGATVNISGTGATSTFTSGGLSNGVVGALKGPDNNTGTWAGSVNLSGSAYVAAGANGVLILTGSITGNGPLVFTGNVNSASEGSEIVVAPSPTNSSTYTGETDILAGPASAASSFGQVVQLGANNALSLSSGINFESGAAQNLTLDLNGYNQSSTYLTGAGEAGYSITSTTGSSTLTITSGTIGTQTANFGAVITGPISIVMNDPTGLGKQVISGTNTYTGSTTILKGTLSAGSSQAFSSNPVTLRGGTLGLQSHIVSTSAAILTSSSFGSFTLNEGTANSAAPFVTGTGATSTLQLTTSGVNGIANSAFYPTPIAVSDAQGFTVTFNFSQTSSGFPADGIAFVLQKDSRGASAVGAGGGSLGYGGTSTISAISPSVAVLFETYPVTGHFGTALTTNGLIPNSGTNTAPYIPIDPVAFLQPIDVTLVYDGPNQTLTETLHGDTSGANFSRTYTGVDYSALLGGSANSSTTAYVGFTGSTGGASSTSVISNFSYATNLSAPQSITNEVDAPAGSSGIQLDVTSGSVTSGATVGLINISSGASVAVTTSSGARGVLITPSVTIASAASFTGKLDLGGNDLDINGGTMTLKQVTTMLASGFNAGKWTGQGIASSAAAADTKHLTALSVLINDTGANNGTSTGTPLYTTLDNATVADGSILVKYTYYGDANLDGAVDGTDYSRIDNGYLSHLTGWYNGDFNYDGVINGSDYTLIDNAYNSQGSSLGSNPLSLIAAETSQIASSGGTGASAAVPEPTSIGLIGTFAIGLLARRRRRM